MHSWTAPYVEYVWVFGQVFEQCASFFVDSLLPGSSLGRLRCYFPEDTGSFSVMTTTWGDRRLRVAHKNFDVCENEMGGFGLFGLLVVFFVGFYGYGFFADDHVWFGFFLLNVDD